MIDLFATAAHQADRHSLRIVGVAGWAAGVASFALTRLGDAGARFRYRLLRLSGSEEAYVRRDRVLRKLLGATMLVGGVLCLLRGFGAW